MPRKSDMCRLTVVTRVALRSGPGCYLKRASLSFLRQCLMYFWVVFGTFSAPSLDCTVDAGVKVGESLSFPSLDLLLALVELVLYLSFLPALPCIAVSVFFLGRRSTYIQEITMDAGSWSLRFSSFTMEGENVCIHKGYFALGPAVLINMSLSNEPPLLALHNAVDIETLFTTS